MRNHTMIPVIISGLSPESYKRMQEKKEEQVVPIRSKNRVAARKARILQRTALNKNKGESKSKK